MATLPDTFGRRPVPQPSRAIATIGNAGAVGNALQEFGGQVNQAGMQILDREATAAAKDADTAVADKLRALIYDPESGFANLNGAAAVNARQATLGQVDAIAAQASAGLNAEAARKVQEAVAARVERAKNTIEGHTSDQRSAWIDGARDARIQASYQDVMADPAAADVALQFIEGEIRGRAADKGWSAEQTNLEVTKAKSTVYKGIVEKMAIDDPEGALQYVKRHAADMLGTDVIDLNARLSPIAKDAEGRRIGAAALNGFDLTPYTTEGGSRPDAITGLQPAFRQGMEAMFAAAPPEVRDALKIGSGFRSVERQAELWAAAVKKYGSAEEARKWVAQPGHSQHNAGNAADLKFASDDARQWVHDNAARFGLTFPLANENWHIELATARDGTPAVTDPGMAGLIDIADPRVRSAAMSEYNLRSGERRAGMAAEFQADATAMDEAANYAAQNGTLPPNAPGVADVVAKYQADPEMAAKAAALAAQYQDQVAFGQALYGVRTAPASAVNAQLAALQADVAKPGNTAEDARQLAIYAKAAQAKNEEIAADPAKFALSVSAQARKMMEIAQSSGPATQGIAANQMAAAMDSIYARNNVPESMRTLLPKDMATKMVASMNAIPSTVAPQALEQFQAGWGDQSQRVAKELAAAGLSQEFVDGMRVSDNPGLAAEVMSLRGKSVADLKTGLASIDTTAASQALDAALQPYQQAFEAGDTSGQAGTTFNATYGTAERLMYDRMRRGMDATSAAEKTAADLFPGTPLNATHAQVILPDSISPADAQGMMDAAVSDAQLQSFDPAIISAAPQGTGVPAFDKALDQYPILRNLGLHALQSPGGDGNMLEFWPSGEPGDASFPRPKSLPLDANGIQIYSDKTRPIDVLGDVVSHQLVTTDPKIAAYYDQFRKSLTPEQDARLVDQYKYAVKNEGETRPMSQWLKSSGLPAYFRGYAFKQWDNPQGLYTPSQMKMFDEMMAYLQQPGQMTTQEQTDRATQMASLQDNGVWLGNSNGDGAVLHYNVGGYFLPVTNRSGSPYEIKWADARGMEWRGGITGSSLQTITPTAATQPPTMGGSSTSDFPVVPGAAGGTSLPAESKLPKPDPQSPTQGFQTDTMGQTQSEMAKALSDSYMLMSGYPATEKNKGLQRDILTQLRGMGIDTTTLERDGAIK